MPDRESTESLAGDRRVGVWLIGARGSIAVAVAAGKALLQEGLAGTTGLLTASPPFDSLPLISWEGVEIGGVDMVETPLADVLEAHARESIIPWMYREPAARDLAGIEGNICHIPSRLCLDRPDQVAGLRPWDVVQEIRRVLAEFKAARGLDRVIVVNVASTEALLPEQREVFGLERWDDLEERLKAVPGAVSWSILYAAAALLQGCAYINFTPNPGMEIQALAELAARQRLPHAGKDGKTGETLLKSVLAPMFYERRLQVLSWQSYNMLGNNDGRSLADPRAREAKIRSKSLQLQSILKNSPDLHTQVSIDYVPSLGDWKTAWNYIHFEGFLGVRMALSFTWNGCDTALAAPLVLDLIRFVELDWSRGGSGPQGHLDAFFKSPTSKCTHDFRVQVQKLYAHFGFSGEEAEVP